MSIKDKLLAKTGDLTLPPAAPLEARTPAPALPPVAAPRRDVSALPTVAAPSPTGAAALAPAAATSPVQRPPIGGAVAPARTGPGQMLQFRGQMLAVEGELQRLRDELQTHEGALPTRGLDAATVRPSRWANRHPDAFTSPEFIRLKQDIEQAGGNVQPIRVRQLPEAERSGEARYEVIFGHRRHRACLELGLPVLATIDTEPVSDLDLFAAMDRENRERADLSPYEQGLMYRHALDEKLYPSNRRLAEALGVSHTWVANVLSVADLPTPVVECFRSPLEIQHRHAKALAPALESQRKAVLKRAEKLRQMHPRPAAAQVLAQLLGEEAAPRRAAPTRHPLRVDGRPVGHWAERPDGGLDVQIDAPADARAWDPKTVAQALAAAMLALGQGAD